MKYKKILLLFAVLSLALVFVSCESQKEDKGFKVKVVYELEGGTYKNSGNPLVLFYGFEKGTENLIKPPGDIPGMGEVQYGGDFEIEGWYREKTADGEYRGKWDFATDRVGGEGVTLYARWIKPAENTYELCYRDKDGNVCTIHKYGHIEKGAPFKDFLNKAKKFGVGSDKKTGLGIFRDESGRLWDENFGHPGGENGSNVRVFVDYIDGDFELCANAAELRHAVEDLGLNVYLLNDIDFDGDSGDFCFAAEGRKYRGIIDGNGHKITGIRLKYYVSKNALKQDPENPELKNSIFISLFGDTEDAVIKNVIFSDVFADVKVGYGAVERIYLSPLAGEAVNTKFIDVNFAGSYTITEIPPSCEIIREENEPYIKADSKTSKENVSVTFTEIEK